MLDPQDIAVALAYRALGLIGYAFEMRKDVAAEALETDGWCNQEGRGRGGAKRVHVDALYKSLRDRLGI